MTFKTTTNLTNFKSTGALGDLLERARTHNQLDDQLQSLLDAQFKGLSLCLVEGQSVTLVASNSAVAYRADKQRQALIAIIREIQELSNTTKLLIKVNKKET